MRLSFVGFASSPFDEFAFVANLSCQERADVIGYICGEDECASKPQHIFANRNTQLAIVMAVDKKKKLPLSREPFPLWSRRRGFRRMLPTASHAGSARVMRATVRCS